VGDDLHLAQPRELTQRLDLDLAHAFSCQPESASDLIERARLAAFESVAHEENGSVALGDRL
jgi:hypothetical protein